jgi:uncharacterized protein YxjI
MQYPLQLTFKIMAIAQQITVRDAQNTVLFHVKQKAFKLKESVTIFGDVEQTVPLFTINADRMIDFNARYTFTDVQTGATVGAVRRRGARSLFKAFYEVIDGEEIEFTITEANAWTKVLDGLFREIPIVGMFSGYFLHPAYNVARTDGEIVLRLEKKPAFLEGKFEITRLGEFDAHEETRLLLATMMTLLLERARG